MSNLTFLKVPLALVLLFSASSFARRATLTAKIDADGRLQAHSESTDRGDGEVFLRYAFRQVSESQWKDLVQRISYVARLGGTISNVRISPPEKTEEPFTLAYDYTLKDFAGGDKHRFAVPLPPLGIPDVKDEELRRKTPLWLSYAGESNCPRDGLPHAVSLDPKFARAWIELGGMYAGIPEKGFALNAFQKAVEADPKQVVPYKILALAYAVDHRLKDAIATWQKLQSIAPRRSRPCVKPRWALHGAEALPGGGVTI
jgi:tetratricopeptide (TPR) repeat protein